MENKKEIDAKAYIERLISPIFNKVLQETDFNHTMVGNEESEEFPSLYNPHNYRLYFAFSKGNFKPIESMVNGWSGKLKNYNSEFTALGEGVRITIKKRTAEVINKLTEQEWFLVNRSKAKEEIVDILTKIDAKCIQSLRKFIEVYGGSTDYKILHREERPNLILNTKSDNKILHEPYIDSLPLDMTFETSIVKKPYKESNVEFKEPIYAARHLENSALYEFAPEIVNAIYNLSMSLPGERLKAIESKINSIPDIFTIRDSIQILNQGDKDKLSNWIFERFKQ